MTAPAGQVYYTLDGTDPRLPGGAVHPNARLLIDPTLLLTQTTRLMARALSDGEWSALSDAVFRVGLQTPGPQSLRITEVNYHPYDPTAEEIAAGFGDADDFEFLEVTNVSDQPVDLTNVQLVKVERNGSVEGIAFAFADSQIHELAPGGRLVVVEDVDAFRFRYGPQATVAGRWDGGLSNASELLTLAVGPLVIEQFTYADHWYPATDGRGPTLQARDEAVADVAAFQRPEAWRASSRLGGSPGEPDLGVLGDANGDGRFDSQDLLQVFQAGEYEDGVPGNSTWEEGDWTGDGEFDSADLLAAFRAGGYTSAAVSLRQDRIDRLFARLG